MHSDDYVDAAKLSTWLREAGVNTADAALPQLLKPELQPLWQFISKSWNSHDHKDLEIRSFPNLSRYQIHVRRPEPLNATVSLLCSSVARMACELFKSLPECTPS